MTPDEVWTTLVKLGGAYEPSREEFLAYCDNHDDKYPFEFRFCGHFGFGGKVRRRDGIYRADYYPENKSTVREHLLAVLNEALKEKSEKS